MHKETIAGFTALGAGRIWVVLAKPSQAEYCDDIRGWPHDGDGLVSGKGTWSNSGLAIA